MEQRSDITDLCSQMMLQLHDFYDPNKVNPSTLMLIVFSLLFANKHTTFSLQINVKIKIVSGSPCGVVAAESKRAQANWVVLDK